MSGMDRTPSSTALRLRGASSGDAEAIAAIYAPWVREPGVCFELEPPSAATIADRIAAVQRWYPWLVVERDGVVFGYAYAARLRERPAYDWAAETSIYLAPDELGRGVGARLYAALLDILVAQGLRWAYGALVVDPTAMSPSASQRFHARMGFEAIGRFAEVGHKRGRWWDIEWWRRPLGAEDPAPQPIRPVEDPALREWIAARLELG